MQIKLFTIPIGDNGSGVSEMNGFLRANKILEVQSQFAANENGAYWSFCVKYIEKQVFSGSDGKAKTDYREILDDEVFKRFSRLREIRKKIAAEEGIPAFSIFTDEELAGLAKLPEINAKTMQSIKGIGEKKAERYGEYFSVKLEQNEKNRKPDSKSG